MTATKIHIQIYCSDDLSLTSEIRFDLVKQDTVFSGIFDRVAGVDTVLTIELDEVGSYSFNFENYSDNTRKHNEISFSINGKEAYVVLALYFNRTSKGVEYLKDLSVKRYYNSCGVFLNAHWTKKIGERPFYRLRNSSDTTFYGNSMTSHFYGSIARLVNGKWITYQSAACGTIEHEPPLIKGTEASSFVPHFSSYDVFRIKEKGRYRYSVILATQKEGFDFPIELIATGTTRKRVLDYYVLEDVFERQ